MSPCESCHAGCCRSFAVPVSGADVLRIERELGLEFHEFACRWNDEDGSIAKDVAPQFFFADEPETPFVICLTHTLSDYFPGTSKCKFLRESPPDAEHPQGQARCSIYAHRPGACRAFPLKLNPSGDLAIIQPVPECGRPGNTHPVYDLCPREWQPEDVEPISAVQDLVVARHEMTFFHDLAKVWNREPRRWESFPSFLRLVYANRVQPATSATMKLRRAA